MTWVERLRTFGRTTEPSAASIAAARTRLGLGPNAALAHRLLRALPTPHLDSEIRIRTRLRSKPSPIGGFHVRAPFAIAMLAAAAAWTLAVWPRPDLPIAIQLEPGTAPVPVGDLVSLVPSGTGAAGGTERHPHIRWRSGRLDVSVVPNQGVQLSVETPEGMLRVVGTVFSVDRTILGTRVDVSRGEVEVTCAGQSARRVVAAQSTACLPTTAAGLVGRARALSTQSGTHEDVIASLDAAAALAPSGPLGGEILALRFEVLRSRGQDVEALQVAREYQERGFTERKEAVAGAAATLALSIDNCALAKEWALHADEDTASAIRQRCLGRHAPN